MYSKPVENEWEMTSVEYTISLFLCIGLLLHPAENQYYWIFHSLFLKFFKTLNAISNKSQGFCKINSNSESSLFLVVCSLSAKLAKMI